MNKDKLKEKYDKNGYIIIDNFLPTDLINDINDIMLQSTYVREEQIREGKYKMYRELHKETHPFWHNSDLFPNDNENFIMAQRVSEEAVNNPLIESVFNSNIKEYIKLLNPKVSKCKLTAFKSEGGDTMRCHLDDYNADIGFILYCSKEWKFDWGGLLLTLTDENTISAISPKFNRIVFIQHEKLLPHAISIIENYAELDRLMVVGFCLPKDIISDQWNPDKTTGSVSELSKIIEWE